MRLILKDKKQKELIKEEKNVLNLSFLKLAAKLRIKDGRLRAYYYDNLLMPEELFERFSLKEEYRRFIIDKKSENWGQIKGGKISDGNTKIIKLPKDSMDLAELYGVMLGDGNLCRIKGYKLGTYQIRITGDSRHDKLYFKEYLKPLIERLFDVKATINYLKNSNGVTLTVSGRELVNFFENKGFKPGDKIINQLEIPDWIKQNKNFLKVCLRGLYDTDGSVYKLTNQNSYQICFTNYNQILLNDVRNALLDFGIKVSKISRMRDITITKKSELRKFLNEVGFRNSRHLNKVKRWNL